MDIILDANVLIADFQLAGAAFRVALDGVHRTDARLLVPEVVLAEVEAKYKEELRGISVQAARASRSYHRITGKRFASLPSETDLEAEGAAFGAALRQKLAEYGAIILPWPTVAHEDVVRRVFAARKPMKSERGYRDTLIWESVLAHAVASPNRKIAFVTSNTSDFCDGEVLHPDLVNDLVQAGLTGEHVAIDSSLKRLNERVFEPTLAFLDEVKRQLASDTYPGVRLRDWLRENLRDNLADEDVQSVATDLPAGCGRTYLTSKFEITFVDVREVRKLSSDDLLADVFVNVNGEINISLDGRDYESSPEAREWIGSGYEGGHVDITTATTLGFGFDIVIEPGGIASAELREAEGEHSSFRIE